MGDDESLSGRPASGGLELPMIVEVEGVGDEAAARAVLDACRECASSAGIADDVTLYRVTCEDVRGSGVLDRVGRAGPVPSPFIEPRPFISEARPSAHIALLHLTPPAVGLDTTPSPETAMSDLLDRINDIRSTCHPRPAFTLETGRGETYRHNSPVVYAHGEYEESSVLAGQSRRLFVEQWDTWDEARAALAEVRMRDRSFEFEDHGEGGGTTYIPSRVLTRHLPDDEG